MSSSSVNTTIDKSVMDPGSVANARNSAPKQKARRSSGAGGGGSASGVGSGTGNSIESEARQKVAAKLHPAILALVERLANKEFKLTAEDGTFVRNGNAEIQIWLSDKSDETLLKLKELGFEVVLDPKSAKLVIGRIPLSKLPALVELNAVKYIAPQLTAL